MCWQFCNVWKLFWMHFFHGIVLHVIGMINKSEKNRAYQQLQDFTLLNLFLLQTKINKRIISISPISQLSHILLFTVAHNDLLYFYPSTTYCFVFEEMVKLTSFLNLAHFCHIKQVRKVPLTIVNLWNNGITSSGPLKITYILCL